MKKGYSIVIGIVYAFLIFLGFKEPTYAASYKAQIILESYEVAEDYKIGEDTHIKIVLKNTDASYFVRNLLINCSSSGNTVVPVEGKSNQFYLDVIRPNETAEVEIPIVITHAEGGYASMTFNIEYMSDDSRWTASSYIVFPVNESGSEIVLKTVNVPAEATANSSVLISSYFLNSSDKDMFNTEFVVSGEITGGEKTASLGTIATKRNAYGESYVSFNDAGKKIVALSIRYEDANGDIHEEDIGRYSIEVKDNSVPESSTTVSDSSISDGTTVTPNKTLNVSTILLIASGVIVLIILVVVVINVTRRRK